MILDNYIFELIFILSHNKASKILNVEIKDDLRKLWRQVFVGQPLRD